MHTTHYVPVNDRGRPIGQYNARATYSDEEIEGMRTMDDLGYTYREIGMAFAASPHTVGRICRFERRAETVADWRRVGT